MSVEAINKIVEELGAERVLQLLAAIATTRFDLDKLRQEVAQLAAGNDLAITIYTAQAAGIVELKAALREACDGWEGEMLAEFSYPDQVARYRPRSVGALERLRKLAEGS